MKQFRNGVRVLNKALRVCSYVVTTAIMLVISASVIMRILFKSPIGGLTDIVMILMGLLVAFSLTVAEQTHKHIQVDFVKAYLPPIPAKILYTAMHGIALVFICLVAYRFFIHFQSTWNRGDQTMTISIPYWPVSLCLSVGMVVFAITYILNRIDALLNWKGGKE